MSETKKVTSAELKEHTSKSSHWVLLNGKVYDVTKFLDEHPGGDEVILAEAGKDATEAFEDVGHSDEARDLLKDMLVGDFEGTTADLKPVKVASSYGGPSTTPKPVTEGPSVLAYIFPLAFLGAYLAYRYIS